jgi:hypothetical protein
MIDSDSILRAIAKVNDQASFIQDLLIDALRWELPKGAQCIPDIAYEWTTEELRAEGLDTRLLEVDDAADLTEAEARAVFDKLSDITVCDAAAGSGAFLLGMLHRLVRLHYAIYKASPSVAALIRSHLAEINRRLPKLTASATESQVKYQLKRAVIQRSLFGVDIEASAIQIAQLRMWLSLCVEHEAEFVHDIPPLPNLDYNLRVGNSLTGHYLGIDFELETDTRSPRFRPILDELDRLEAQYYEMTDEQEKDDQRKEIENLQWRLLEEGVRDELRRLPARRRAIEDALQRRRAENLFPEMVDFTPEEQDELAWLQCREVELGAGLRAFERFFRDLAKDQAVPENIPFAVPWDDLEKKKVKVPAHVKRIRGKLNVPRERFWLTADGRYRQAQPFGPPAEEPARPFA